MHLLLSLLTSMMLWLPKVPTLMLDMFAVATGTATQHLQMLLTQISATADAADEDTSSCKCISSQEQTLSSHLRSPLSAAVLLAERMMYLALDML